MRWRVLLVDDDHHIRIMLKAFLESREYGVELAVNGQDALTKLGEADYDIVVVDYNMPEVDGLEVLRHTRQSRPSLPVVLMTGGGRSAITARAIVELGAQACLLKPFDLQELDRTLAEALSPQLKPLTA
jgi:CheY-like chemotaxis protein